MVTLSIPDRFLEIV